MRPLTERQRNLEEVRIEFLKTFEKAKENKIDVRSILKKPKTTIKRTEIIKGYIRALNNVLLEI